MCNQSGDQPAGAVQGPGVSLGENPLRHHVPMDTSQMEPALPDPADAARTLSHWMSVFWKLHPGEKPIKPDLHVSVETLTTQMSGWLIHQAGGLEAFWRLQCAACRFWQVEQPDILAVRIVETRLFCDCGMGEDRFPELPRLLQSYRAWRAGIVKSLPSPSAD